jgi:tetratricopeptide (TPR) repeat protein
MTAINSNVILPIARDCAGEHGDLWVLYIGNNEVVGPFGAGTVFGPQVPSLAFIRGTIALKQTRIGQALADLGDSLFQSKALAQRSTIGLDLFLEHQIRQEDPRMQKVYEHFAGNLKDIVRVGAKSGAKVLVSTVASNLKDCTPFASLHRRALTPDQRTQWQLLYDAGVKADAAGNMSNALSNYREAERIDDRYADLEFREARDLWRLGDFDGARRRFQMARDADALRVRADTRINSIIHEVATSGKKPAEVYFVDGNAVLAQHSPHGVIDEDLLYEHVHLNFSGNYLLARALAEQISALLPETAAGKLSKVPPKDWLMEGEALAQLGLNDYERCRVFEILRHRLEGPPFTTQLGHLEQYERLTAAAAQYRAR